MLKRLIAVLAIVLTSGLLATPLVASAATCPCVCETTPVVHIGDLIKVADRSTVFYIAENGKRYNFPNAGVYKSWFGNDFSKVKTVSKAELQLRPLGGYVSYRPGTKLIQFNGSSAVYAIGKNGELRHLETPKVAAEIFGANWKKMIVKLPASFYGAYSNSFVIKTASDYTKVTQSEPVEISFTVPLHMTVMR
ncbi:MAG: hypothetical protein WCJ29_01895 [bacterium]